MTKEDFRFPWIEITSDPNSWPPVGEEILVQMMGLKLEIPNIFLIKIREGEGLGSYLKWKRRIQSK